MSPSSSSQQATVITGTLAAARRRLADFDSARRADGSLLWELPDILPRDAWIRRSWQECVWEESVRGESTSAPVLLTRWQELALWEEAIESAAHDILLNSHATARAASEAWQLLHAWEAPQDASAFHASDDCAAFFAWMSRVRQQLRDREWITLAELPRALERRLAAGAWRPAGEVSLVGFDEVAPADQRLFDALGARVLPDAPQQSRVKRVECHDAADELARAASWARVRLETRPDVRIGILIPGLANVAATAERIFGDILHPSYGFAQGPRAFSISGGEPLAATPMISAALLILRLIEGVPREEAAMLWRSPFVGNVAEDGARRKGELAVELRRRGVDEASFRTYSVRLCFPHLAAAAAALPTRARPSQWSDAFSRLLGLAGFPGVRALTRAEAETLEAW